MWGATPPPPPTTLSFSFPTFLSLSLSPILPLYTPHLSHFSFSSPFFSLKLQFPILPLTVDPPFALAPIPRLVSWNAPFWGLRRWFALSDVLKLINLLSLSLSILGTGFSVFTVPLSFRAQFSFRFAARKTTSFLDFGVASYSGNYRLVSSVRSCSPFLVFCSVENLDLLNLYIIKIKIRIIKKVIIKVLDYDHNSSHFFTNILWNYWHVLSQLCSQKETQSFIKTSSLKINNSIKCIFSLILFFSLLWLLIL